MKPNGVIHFLSSVAFAFVLFGTLGTSVALAADQPWDAPAFSEDPAALSQAASAVSEPDEQDVIVFLEERHVSFDSEGRRDSKRRLIYKVLSQKGAEDMSSVGVEWQPWHESGPTIRARVIDPDLSVHDLDPKTLTEAGSQSGEQDVYTDVKTLEGPLPAMMPGAIVEETFDVAETQPLFSGGVGSRFYLDWDVPVERSRVILDWPNSLPMHVVVKGPMGLQPEATKEGGRSTWMVSAEHVAAEKEVPPFLPSDVPRGPEVEFSTGSSWQVVAGAYSQILDQQIVVDQARAIAASAIAGAKTREHVIAALVAELHKEVRYTGVEFGKSSLVPETPAEMLQRKYGDCKDKASLLVAMLRSAGVPAYVALLSANGAEDIDPQMPGISRFTHAIVYVPGAKSGPGVQDLWIDATDEYARPGQIPGDDQGRWALIIKPDQTALVRTPENTSADNRTIETREFTLSENGPARVVETTDTWGTVEAEYRSYFDDDAKKLHDALDSYMKNTYLADKLTKLDSTKVSDFSVPFRARLEADSAKRGTSESADAAVAILLSGLTTRIPDYFTSEDLDRDKKPTATPRTEDFILPEPYVEEWRYHMIPPLGFAANPLPAGREQQIGPAKLTAEFEKNADGTVDATIRFDTGKRRMTAQEADALRTGIIALNKEKAVMVTFNEIGEADLAAGKVSDALAQFRALVAMHPKEALHHDQIARALLAGGMGELAREEAKKATELEPTSADAYSQLGFVLEDDLVGRQFKKGFDLNGAIAAFQKAVDLDPKNSRIRGNYAILLEHNGQGVRYGPGARLNDAIDQYRAIGDDLVSLGLGNNLPVALVWAKRFPELKEQVEKEAPSNARESQLLIARAALDGSAAAIAEAAADEPDSDSQRTVLLGAGAILMELRMYPQAADLLSAGAKGNQNAASFLAEAALLRNMKPHDNAAFPDSDPRSIAAKFLIEDQGAATSVGDISSFFTAATGKYFTDADSIAFWTNVPAAFRMRTAKIGFPLDVVLDVDLAGMQYAVEGSDALGYKITCSGPSATGGTTNLTLFVVKENGKYKIAGVNGLMNSVIGKQIIGFVDAGNLAVAAQWLDWIRDGAGSSNVDDPLADQPIVRMWKKGQGQDKDAIRYAAAALMAERRDFASEAAPILLEGLAKATSDEQRMNLDRALADAYQLEDKFGDELPVARRLVKEAPDSDTAAERLETALVENKESDESIQIAQDRMSKNPDDPQKIRDYAWVLWLAGRLDEAQTVRKKLIDTGKATSGDYNQIAWDYLIENKVTPEAVQQAEHATLMSDGQNGGIVDTQAAIYAEIGRASEAYTMELQAIDLDGDEEPNDPSWYVFGRIAEQYGERDAAIEDYKKCKAPDNSLALSDSPYALAQRRLNALEQTAK